MTLLRIWRTTIAKEARELVQALGKILEWGARESGAFDNANSGLSLSGMENIPTLQLPTPSSGPLESVRKRKRRRE